MSTIDLESEYNNRARVPEHPAIIASWASDATAYRHAHPPRVIRYGDGERHTLDLFEAGAGTAVMFIHGGYWQALDKSFFSHMARGLNAHGVSVAVPSYDLCPDVTIGDIIRQMRRACLALHDALHVPVTVSGHSAGGHLAACLLATEDCVPHAYSISGLFDLAPLIQTSLNEKLQLNPERAKAYSPLFWPAPAGKSLDVVVGGEESGEFHRQSAAMAERWGAGHTDVRVESIPGANHFTVIGPLADSASPMVARLRDLACA